MGLLQRVLPASAFASGLDHEGLLSSLDERVSALSAQDIEEVVGLARELLDGTGPIDIRQRVQELRSEAETCSAGVWWDGALTQLRSWWAGTPVTLHTAY